MERKGTKSVPEVAYLTVSQKVRVSIYSYQITEMNEKQVRYLFAILRSC